MANQLGGQRLGGFAPAANTLVQQPFRNLLDGVVKTFILTLLISLKSSAAAFAAVVDTNTGGSLQGAAEGVDDLDILLNAVLTSISMNWDESTFAFFNNTPAQLRTMLGYLLKRDIGGTFVQGSSVPISSGSATQFQIQLEIPVALMNLLDDGEIFQQGSNRLSKGELDMSWGASLTPAVVLANGTANVSGQSYNLYAVSGVGTQYDCGPIWQFKRYSGLATASELGDGPRLLVADILAAAANTATGVRFGDTGLATPREYAAIFQGQAIPTGGFDITFRCTPYVFIPPRTRFADLAQYVAKKYDYDASGPSSMGFYDMRIVSPNPSVVERIGKESNAGGPVAIQHPSPRSIPAGTPISPGLQGMLPIRSTAPSAAGSNAQVVDSPQHVAATVVQKQVATARQGALVRSFYKK